jgi:BMFP domain-containing protein YqiC
VAIDNKFFDDIAKLGQSAAGAVHGLKSEAETAFKGRIEHALLDMDIVSREEFNAALDMAKIALENVTKLEKKIAALEKQLKKK